MIPAFLAVPPAPGCAGLHTGGPNPARSSRALVRLLVAFVLAALVWAALAHVDTLVRAAGRIVPAHGLQRVAHMEGGTVAAVLVAPGDAVIAGQPLLRLEPVEADAIAARDAAARAALAARAARLAAEVGRASAPVAPDGPDPAAARAEASAFEAHAAEQQSARAAADAHVREAARAETAARADAAVRRAAVDAALREAAMLAPLAAKGIEPEANAARARDALAEARAGEQSAAATVERAAAARAAAMFDRAALERRFRAAAADAYAQTSADLAAASRAAPAFAERVRRMTVRAPAAGIVQRVLVPGAGAVARPGEPLVELVGAADPLLVEARVAAKDIATVRIGQPARIRIAAYESAVFGTCPARVTRIAPDAEEDAATHARFYTVRLALLAPLRDADGRRMRLRAGMDAEVALIGPPRTVLSYVLTPFARLRETALTER